MGAEKPFTLGGTRPRTVQDYALSEPRISSKSLIVVDRFLDADISHQRQSLFLLQRDFCSSITISYQPVVFLFPISTTMNPPSSTTGIGLLAELTDVAAILDRQADARNITEMFNYLEKFPPSGFHPLLTNVTLAPVQELRTGNILPLLQGPDWDDPNIVGFYQVVQGPSFGRTMVQLTNDIVMPALVFITHDPQKSVYDINNFGPMDFERTENKTRHH